MIYKCFKFGCHIIRNKIYYMFVILKTIHWDHIIRYYRNELLFENEYIIIVHKKNCEDS